MPAEVLNPFVPNAPFLYPLKTEIRKVFWCFHGVEKGCIGNEWVKFWKSDMSIISIYLWFDFIADLTSPNPAQNYVFNVENKNTR